MRVDIQGVADILRDAAETKILPRFRNLAPSDIDEKNPGDLVTIADREAEAFLSQRLLELRPNAIVVGEEANELKPVAADEIARAEWAWIIDPLDGTHNFAHGKDRFAVIVALVHKGDTIAGWIFDPVRNCMAQVERGSGAEISGGPLSIDAPKPITQMSGSLGRKLADRTASAAERDGKPYPKSFVRYRCVGLEYMDLANGKLDFARYGGKLMPWDHAAGVLLHKEAGGYSAFGPSAKPYSPTRRPASDHLLLAPNRETWLTLSDLMG